MNPSRKPSWRVVTQRFARAIVALASPPPGGHDLVEQLVLERADQLTRTSSTFARTQPARSTTPDRSTTPGSSVAEGLPTAAGTIVAIAAAYAGSVARSSAGVSAPGADSEPADRDPLGLRPVDEALRRAACSARRPRTVAAAPSAEPTRNPACQTPVVAPGLLRGAAASLGHGSPRSDLRDRRHHGRRDRRRRRASSIRLDVDGTRRRRSAGDGPEGVDVAGRSWTCAGRRTAIVAAARRLEAVDREQLDSADAVAVAEVDDRDPLARDRRDDRPEQRVVGAAEEERVDPRGGRQREDEVARLVALAEQRGQRRPRRPPRPPGRSSSPASTSGTNAGVACS